jgi:[histone H3]-lysine4 N-trimethyltransferase MLL3
MRRPNRRCAYHCSIIDVDNRPVFRIRIQENDDEPAQEFQASNAKAVWHQIVDDIDALRRQHGLVKMFSVFVSGEDLYGLTVRIAFALLPPNSIGSCRNPTSFD